MSTRTGKSIDITKLLILGAVTAVVLGGVAYGVNYLWQKQFGPTQASAEDCRQAQRLFEQVAQRPPAKPGKVSEWVSEVRPQWLQLKNDGLQSQGLIYSSMVARKTSGDEPQVTQAAYQDMLGEAHGHCEDSGVKLNIAPLP
jgi:hypothetical protein